MKKIFFSILMLILAANLFSQITAKGTYRSYFKIYTNIEYLFVFNDIQSSDALVYNGTSTNINWYKFTDPTNSIGTQNENFNIENATGYILDVDGTKYSIWVIDYKNYIPTFNTLIAENSPTTQCYDLNLNLDANIPLIQYKSLSGSVYTIDRKFTLTYNSKEWTSKWDDKVITQNIVLPQTDIFIGDAPLCDTKFKIEGDQFATDLQINPLPVIESPTYSAVAVECHITTTAATRDQLQEGDRPETAKTQSGSAPLDIMFESNANVPVTNYYNWQIFKDGVLLFNRTDQDQRYTFNEAGTFKVTLRASNDYCSYEDSVIIKVSTSQLEVPYVFTPNGDGINDEFRVAYVSIVQFKCWVFNRWGRKIYYWTDPQKGWDGTINGKPATAGAYLYIIEAVGADGQEHHRKGTVNLLRGKLE